MNFNSPCAKVWLGKTLGVVLPSFIIILLVCALIRNFLKYKSFQAFLGGVRPCVIGLILAVAATFALSTFFTVGKIGDSISIRWQGIVIFATVAASSNLLKKLMKKPPSPILLILISAVLGMALGCTSQVL